MTRGSVLAAGAVFAITLTGCGGSGVDSSDLTPVQGVVLLGGQPLPNAQVTFTPTGEMSGNAIATGVTDDQGRFTLTTSGKPGAVAGDHTVTVSEGPLPDGMRSDDPDANQDTQAQTQQYLSKLKNRPIPDKYGVLATSGETVTVKPGQSDYKIELSR